MTKYVVLNPEGRPDAFYDAMYHKGRIPEGAVEISEELWESWLSHTHCKALRDGALVDVPLRLAPMTLQRAQRVCQRILAQTTHTQAADEPEASRATWAAYRAQIRAIAATTTDDASAAAVVWPDAPR